MVIIAVALLGLCAGSFVEAYTWRLRQQAKSKSKTARQKYSITKGRSMCPHCRHVLGFWDLIPLFSWLWLRGKCRYCRKPIGWQAPALELASAGLFVVSYWQWPYSLSVVGGLLFAAWLVCLALLLALAVYDLRWMLLPDRMISPLLIASATLAGLVSIEISNPNHVWWALGGAVVLSGLFWALFELSDGKWIGGGDVKIAVGLGIIAGGLLESVLVLFLASLLGSIVGLPLLFKGRAGSHKLPFGPFLIVATVAVFLWGADLIDWYRQLLAI